MCGIFGIYNPKAVLDENFLKKSIDVVSYRGPDAEGYYINNDKTVGLAHRRLSIIDLSMAGNQPMSDEERRYWIVFNGEIYNFRELRATLIQDGYRFVSSSDTEVLLHAYRKWGAACIDRLNGMFAFCIFDALGKTFFLARDRLGKKPLFYALYNDIFIFSSELKQINSSALVPNDIDPDALNYYFTLGYIPGEGSLMKHAKKLPSGYCLEFKTATRELKMKQYWNLPFLDQPKVEEEILEEIEYLLTDSVKKRLISDVPLGVFLSGGVDSSLVAAFMRKIHNGDIKTFSVGFEGSSMDELKYSRIVSRHLGTIHREIVVKPDFQKDLEYVSGLMDEPIFDSSILPTYYLSRYTREDVTVALSGDGGDELFGGYTSYKSGLAAHNIGRFAVPPLNSLAGLLGALLPEGVFGKNTLYGISRRGIECFTYPSQVFREEERRKLLNPGLKSHIKLASPLKYRGTLMDGQHDYINRMCYTDIKTSLADDILVKVDRTSMFNSLEVRCPLLDYRVAEYAFRHVPGNLKIKGGIKKYLLKKLANRCLPPELELERKQGFDIPADFLMKTYLLDRLLSFDDNEFISKAFVSRLVKAQRYGKGTLWHKLFAVYFFLRWLETWKK